LAIATVSGGKKRVLPRESGPKGRFVWEASHMKNGKTKIKSTRVVNKNVDMGWENKLPTNDRKKEASTGREEKKKKRPKTTKKRRQGNSPQYRENKKRRRRKRGKGR